jgi:hypothetical protein
MQWSYKLQLLYHPTCNTCIATEQKHIGQKIQEPRANKQGSCPFPKGVTSAHQHKIQNNPPAAQWQDA